MNRDGDGHEHDQGPFHTPVGSRRTFFQWVIGAVAAIIGAGLAVPLVGYVLSPAFKRREPLWVQVGDVHALKVLEPTQLDYIATVRDGWMESKAQKAVWAVKQAGGEVTVFSPICTHLGCGYRWDESVRKFKCPCHGSVFDVTGTVVGGPAPRPLDTLPVKVEAGRLFVIYKEFVPGHRTSVEI
jgi:menaquinol-cytochrome c reductase iron-sulfur subunit